MRLFLAPSILFKASVCSRKERGRGDTICTGQAVPAVPRVTGSYAGPCMPELGVSTQVRAVTVQHRPSAKEQGSIAPDIWGIKQGQEKKLTFVSLIAMPLAGAGRHHNIWLL